MDVNFFVEKQSEKEEYELDRRNGRYRIVQQQVNRKCILPSWRSNDHENVSFYSCFHSMLSHCLIELSVVRWTVKTLSQR